VLDGLIHRTTRRSKASADRYRSNSICRQLAVAPSVPVIADRCARPVSHSRAAGGGQSALFFEPIDRLVTAPIAPFAEKGQQRPPRSTSSSLQWRTLQYTVRQVAALRETLLALINANEVMRAPQRWCTLQRCLFCV
jgi:hypothetical protein